MSPRFVLGRENVPCVAEVVNRSLKADCTDFNMRVANESHIFNLISTGGSPPSITPQSLKLDYSNFVQNYVGIR